MVCQRSEGSEGSQNIWQGITFGECDFDTARLGHCDLLAATGEHAPVPAQLQISLLHFSVLSPIVSPVHFPHVCSVTASTSLMLSAASKVFSLTHSMHSVLLLRLLGRRCAL